MAYRHNQHLQEADLVTVYILIVLIWLKCAPYEQPWRVEWLHPENTITVSKADFVRFLNILKFATNMSRGVHISPVLEQFPYDEVVPHLRGYPKRRCSVSSSRIRFCTLWQQEKQDLEMTILSGYEQRRCSVLSRKAYHDPLICQTYINYIEDQFITFMWVLTLAPLFKSSFTTGRWPHWQATKSGVPPSCNKSL